jgi:hypothetical protein
MRDPKKATIILPAELWQRLRLRAVYQSTSATKLVEEAIRLLLRTKPTDHERPHKTERSER